MMQAYDIITQALKEQRFRDAEQEAIQLVKNEPLNPQGWVFLAEALLLQGFSETGRQVFERAWQLDPTAKWAESVLTLSTKIEDSVPRFDIEALLAYRKVTVTALVVVRDEVLLPECIASLAHAVDEVIVVYVGELHLPDLDTVARRVTEIIPCSSEDLLTDVLNEALQRMRTDWVLCVEANEVLYQQDVAAIRTIASLYDRLERPLVLCVGREPFGHNSGELTYEAGRMFPAGGGFRFWGKANPCIGDEFGLHHAMLSAKLCRPVRIRFTYWDVHALKRVEREEARKRERVEPFLQAAKTNLLKSKQCFATYRGLAVTDQQIVSWKADKLLTAIEEIKEMKEMKEINLGDHQ